MIKLRTAIPAAVLSLSALTMASCGKNAKENTPKATKTEVVNKTQQNDTFTKEETDKETKNLNGWWELAFIGAFCSIFGYGIYEHNKYMQYLKDHPDEAEEYFKNNDYTAYPY